MTYSRKLRKVTEIAVIVDFWNTLRKLDLVNRGVTFTRVPYGAADRWLLTVDEDEK